MKFEREIPIGLDARRKKRQGGGPTPPPPPMGLGLSEPWTPAESEFGSALVMCVLAHNPLRPP